MSPGVERGGRFGADVGEHAKPGEVGARGLYFFEIELIALMHRQAVADIGFVHAVEAGNGDRAQVDAFAGMDDERDVQGLGRRMQEGDRRLDGGKRVSGILQVGQQLRARGQHRRGPGGVAGVDAELGRGAGRLVALHRNRAKVKEWAERDVPSDPGRRGGRCLLQRVDQARIVERTTVDGQFHRAGVVAKAVQCCDQPSRVIAGARDQGERTDRGVRLQRDQGGTVVQHLVQRGIASGGEAGLIGQRVCRT